MSSKMASAKDAIASKLSGVVSLTKEAVQGSVAATKSVVGQSLSTVGRMAVGGAGVVLGSLKSW